MVYYWVRESDPLRWGFRTIGDVCHPAIFLGEERVAREQARGMAIGAHPEQNQVKDWEPRGILLCELSNELRFIFIGNVLQSRLAEIAQECIDGSVIEFFCWVWRIFRVQSG